MPLEEDHDQRLKILLTEMLSEFLDLHQEPDWKGAFDFPSLSWQDKEVFLQPPTGQKRFLDLIARLRSLQPVEDSPTAARTWQDSVIFIEVESRDYTTDVKRRLPDYHRMLSRNHGVPVLPLVLYLRVGLQGRGWDVCEERFGKTVIASLRYAYLGLPALDALEYVQGGNILGVALSVFMRFAEDHRPAVKALALQRIATCGENEYRKFLLAECVEAYLPLEGEQQAEFERLLAQEYTEAKMQALTSFDKGRIKGRDEGRDEGRKEGRNEGREEGQRTLLERQLRKRFGPLSPAALQRLQALSADKLAEVGEALITASSLGELGLEP